MLPDRILNQCIKHMVLARLQDDGLPTPFLDLAL
jgi:hypothetical protein